MGDILSKIARMEVRLASVCRFILFYVGLVFILVLVNEDVATKVVAYSLGGILSFSIFFVLFAWVFDDAKKKKSKKKADNGSDEYKK